MEYWLSSGHDMFMSAARTHKTAAAAGSQPIEGMLASSGSDRSSVMTVPLINPKRRPSHGAARAAIPITISAPPWTRPTSPIVAPSCFFR
jgi:hypothetical protein